MSRLEGALAIINGPVDSRRGAGALAGAMSRTPTPARAARAPQSFVGNGRDELSTDIGLYFPFTNRHFGRHLGTMPRIRSA